MKHPAAFTLVGTGSNPGRKEEAPIMGFLVGQILRSGLGHIVTIDVKAEARREGLGLRLMEAAEQRIRSAGGKSIYLETAVNNDAAIRFYKKLGYFVIKTLRGYYAGKLDGLLMRKHLGK